MQRSSDKNTATKYEQALRKASKRFMRVSAVPQRDTVDSLGLALHRPSWCPTVAGSVILQEGF